LGWVGSSLPGPIPIPIPIPSTTYTYTTCYIHLHHLLHTPTPSTSPYPYTIYLSIYTQADLTLSSSLQRGPVRLTDTQLLRYDGREPSRPIYLALNGTIYDVTSNPRIYGPGGMYSVFSGRDATRGFVTGCFAVDNVADLRGVEWVFIPRDVPTFEEKKDEELSDLMRLYREEWVRGALKEVRDAVGHWQKVFRGETGKEYFEVGSVVGRKKETGPVRELCKQRPKEGFEKWMQNRRVARAQASKEEAKKEKKEEGGAGQVQQKDKVEL
jgi:predicted heme/steroid binding protein